MKLAGCVPLLYRDNTNHGSVGGRRLLGGDRGEKQTGTYCNLSGWNGLFTRIEVTSSQRALVYVGVRRRFGGDRGEKVSGTHCDLSGCGGFFTELEVKCGNGRSVVYTAGILPVRASKQAGCERGVGREKQAYPPHRSTAAAVGDPSRTR